MLWFAMFASLCKCMYTFYFTWRMKRWTEFASGIYHAPRLGKSLKLRLIHGNRKKISIISNIRNCNIYIFFIVIVNIFIDDQKEKNSRKQSQKHLKKTLNFHNNFLKPNSGSLKWWPKLSQSQSQSNLIILLRDKKKMRIVGATPQSPQAICLEPKTPMKLGSLIAEKITKDLSE